MAESEEDLRVEKLLSGDRPSVTALGVFGAESIRKTQMAIFMVDVLGRVHVMPPDSIQILKRPRVSDADLDLLEEDVALAVMVRQEDTDAMIVEYLHGRGARNG